ncbi:MAG: hypothetical protein Q8M16_24615 [Pirellulaceae bacterium]|nr:hypothetical protein [Pirellulaceae bacterium]
MNAKFGFGCLVLFFCTVAVPAQAQVGAAAHPKTIVLTYDFNKGPQGWVPGFAEYSLDSLEIYELRANMARLPKEIHAKNRGFRIQGMNRSELISTTGKSRLWLLVGTDSGYEGLTRLYYQEIKVTLTPK